MITYYPDHVGSAQIWSDICLLLHSLCGVSYDTHQHLYSSLQLPLDKVLTTTTTFSQSRIRGENQHPSKQMVSDTDFNLHSDGNGTKSHYPWPVTCHTSCTVHICVLILRPGQLDAFSAYLAIVVWSTMHKNWSSDTIVKKTSTDNKHISVQTNLQAPV